jgi:arylsulfatase A-like enzyme
MQAGMLDIAPTLLRCAGMEIPECMQGKPLFDAIAGVNGKVAFRDEGNEAVLNRLKGLGYV